MLDARDAARDEHRADPDDVRRGGAGLDALPGVLGAEGDRTYIVAIMNPAELRYSGGATLTLSR